jgi:hypothetical protein
MKEFATSAGDQLIWTQPKSIQRYFELHRQNEAFGTLEFRSLWGTLATAKNPIQDWSFKRMGFLNPHITIRFPDADSDYALYYPMHFGGGTLHMLDGRPFSWGPINHTQTRWRFNDKGGKPILSFDLGIEEKQLNELLKLQVAVKVESNHMTNMEFSMMVNLGLYLIILNQEDIAAADAARSASAL